MSLCQDIYKVIYATERELCDHLQEQIEYDDYLEIELIFEARDEDELPDDILYHEITHDVQEMCKPGMMKAYNIPFDNMYVQLQLSDAFQEFLHMDVVKQYFTYSTEDISRIADTQASFSAMSFGRMLNSQIYKQSVE
jgi:hypothetical protein